MRCEALKKTDGKRCTASAVKKTSLGVFCNRHSTKSSRGGVCSKKQKTKSKSKSKSKSRSSYTSTEAKPSYNSKTYDSGSYNSRSSRKTETSSSKKTQHKPKQRPRLSRSIFGDLSLVPSMRLSSIIPSAYGRVKSARGHKKFDGVPLYIKGHPELLNFRIYDIFDIYGRLNAKYFRNRNTATISWSPPVKSYMSKYNKRSNHIDINFKVSKFPINVAAFIVYQSMLQSEGLSSSMEKEFPHYKEIKEYIRDNSHIFSEPF